MKIDTNMRVENKGIVGEQIRLMEVDWLEPDTQLKITKVI